MIQTNQQQRGLALILTLITISAIITITISMIGLSLQQLQLSVDARDSERAFHAASAGLECGQFVRNNQADSFINYDGGEDIELNCMDDSGLPDTTTDDGVDGSGTVKIFNYEIEPELSGRSTCIQIDIALMESDSDEDMTYDFGGQTGEQVCAQSSICTVVIARGYNRMCGTSSGGYEIVRELNAIF